MGWSVAYPASTQLNMSVTGRNGFEKFQFLSLFYKCARVLWV